jgi:hypothetical protein
MKLIKVETKVFAENVDLEKWEYRDDWVTAVIAKGSAVDRALHGEPGEIHDQLRKVYRLKENNNG